MVDKTRIKPLNAHTYAGGSVLYWMGRDQRVADNWGLLVAQAIAEKNGMPLAVVFALPPKYSQATCRHYSFLLAGLADVEKNLSTLGIPFYVPQGKPDDLIIELAEKWGVGCIVTDFLPLRQIQTWKEAVAVRIDVPMYMVDAHNVVPTWVASDKQEFAAYTLRPKLRRLQETYLTEFTRMRTQTKSWPHTCLPVDWQTARANVQGDEAVPEVDWVCPGENAAQAALQDFLDHRLEGYNFRRNLPGEPGQSDLSPYLHYGHIAPQRVALEVAKARAPEVDKEAFLEELLVRRELSDNFCYYCPDYDRLAGAPSWARNSLAKLAGDHRDHLYSCDQLEQAETHDPLWNAAQHEMRKRGKMYGYMRMYWAKKILEWSESPEEAIETAIYLNDRYFLDGRDPNGYVGVLWSIAGLHDRPWAERDIFGQVRYMNYNGAKRKFDIENYLAYVDTL